MLLFNSPLIFFRVFKSVCTLIQVEHEEDACVCRLCGHELPSGEWQRLAAHLARPHQHPCEHCARTFLTKEEKEKHALDVHGIVRGLDLRCGQCTAEFADTAQFRCRLFSVIRAGIFK